MRRKSPAASGLLLAFILVWPGLRAWSDPPPLSPLSAPTTQPVSFKVPPIPWKAPAWQPSPDGHGQYLVFPSHNVDFEIAGRPYAATSFGLLMREQPPVDPAAGTPAAAAIPASWKIVPELYTRNLQPLDVRGDLLWAVEARSRGQAPSPVRLLALNVKNWSEQHRLELPPGAQPFRFDQDGCWFVQSGSPSPAGVGAVGRALPTPPGYRTIALVSLDGKEKFRFDIQPPATAPATAPAPAPATQAADKMPPNPQIAWWAIDPDALWLVITDFRGILPNDAPVRGPTRFLRVDRTGDTRVTIEAPLWSPGLTVNTPQRIVWLERAQTPDGNRYHKVLQLDKQSRKISEVGRIDSPFISDVAADADRLWVRQWMLDDSRVRAFSLKDLAELSQADAPPEASPFKFSLPSRMRLSLLGGDAARVWLSCGQQIIELPDEGEASIRQMPADVMPVPSLHPFNAAGGPLYAGVEWKLFRVAPGSDQALVLKPANHPSIAFNQLQASPESFWMGVAGELLGFSDKMVLERKMPMPETAVITVVGKTCIYRVERPSHGIFKVDLAGGEPVRIESWDRQLREWYKDSFKMEPPKNLEQMVAPSWMGSDGTGKVFLLCQHDNPRRDQTVNSLSMKLWTYDVAKDQWEPRDLGPGLRLAYINSGPQSIILFNGQYKGPPQDLAAYSIVSNGKFRPLGPLPKGWLEANDFDHFGPWSLHFTGKYAYAWTPLGLWRTPLAPSSTAPATPAASTPSATRPINAGTLRGRAVLDGKAVPGVRVLVFNPGIVQPLGEATTDAAGRFAINGLPVARELTVVASKLREEDKFFLQLQTKATLPGNEGDMGDLKLAAMPPPMIAPEPAPFGRPSRPVKPLTRPAGSAASRPGN